MNGDTEKELLRGYRENCLKIGEAEASRRLTASLQGADFRSTLLKVLETGFQTFLDNQFPKIQSSVARLGDSYLEGMQHGGALCFQQIQLKFKELHEDDSLNVGVKWEALEDFLQHFEKQGYYSNIGVHSVYQKGYKDGGRVDRDKYLAGVQSGITESLEYLVETWNDKSLPLDHVLQKVKDYLQNLVDNYESQHPAKESRK